MANRLGVISDTHGLLRPEVLAALQSCNPILHAGDIDKPEILDALRRIAPLHAVRGNNDKDWAASLPLRLTVSIAGVELVMVHNKKDLPKEPGAARVIVFGHSHQYSEQRIDGRLWLNPGSCGRRRFNREITFAILSIENGVCSVRKIIIPRA